jgi:hypothetical protein
MRLTFTFFLACSLGLFTGCASLVDSASQRMANNLSAAILNNNDPETIRAATPAYLVLTDSLLEGDADDPRKLLTAAKLYGSYATTFVDDRPRAQRLAQKSLGYAQKALCLELPSLCEIRTQHLEVLQPLLADTGIKHHATLYGFATAWAGWIQTHSGDWNAIAEIPRLNALLEHCLLLDASHDNGGAHLYLGVLNSQLPPAVGGKPEVGRTHFEQAIAISSGKNLMAKVLYAEHYARLVFDQALHDRLLQEVIADEQEHDGLVLINALARQRAATLLAESAKFF